MTVGGRVLRVVAQASCAVLSFAGALFAFYVISVLLAMTTDESGTAMDRVISTISCCILGGVALLLRRCAPCAALGIAAAIAFALLVAFGVVDIHVTM